MITVCLLESPFLVDVASIKIQCKTKYILVCRLTIADNNTLDKQLQLKTLNLQKGFIVANSSCKDEMLPSLSSTSLLLYSLCV